MRRARRGGAFLAWGDFHARLRFARSTIPEEKWGLLVVYQEAILTGLPIFLGEGVAAHLGHQACR